MAQPTVDTTATIAVTAVDIVAEVTALVPPHSASVLELGKARLPQVIPEDDLEDFAPEDYLVNVKVTGTFSDVLDGPIPHRTWLCKLQTALEDAQKSGHVVTAIRHPTVMGVTFPLWALPVWDSIVVPSEQRMHWVEATRWLSPRNHRKEDQELLEEARKVMARIPWTMKAWALSGAQADSYMGFLAWFLSTSWLAERNIDIMAICINAAAAANAEPVPVYMAPVYLGSQLQGIGGWDAERIRGNRDLCGWRDDAKENGWRYIHIPVNLINIHWVVVVIDLEERTYLWGDSLAQDSYAQQKAVVTRGIGAWTEAVFGTRFINGANAYDIGVQKDEHSCGVCVINAVKTYIHGGDIFNHATRFRYRLEYFIEAANYLLLGEAEAGRHSFIPPDLDPSLVEPLPPVAAVVERPGPGGDDTSCLVGGVADTLRLGQSYKSIGFDREHAIVHKALAERVARKDIVHVRILTSEARRIIKGHLNHGLHVGREEAREPPYMVPSVRQDQYSAWCSLCGDFAALLLLCVACRVGICVRTRDTTGGCLVWDERMISPNFIFHCLFCARRLHYTFELQLRIGNTPRKGDIWLRYDPPILIVAGTLHNEEHSFCRLLHHHMSVRYRRNSESVMLLEFDLEGENAKEDPIHGVKTAAERRAMTKAMQKVLKDIEAAGAFLKMHETAKIIVTIDTHCLEENGLLVYTESNAQGLMATSTLKKILEESIPHTVYQYLSDGEGTPLHAHKSIILNLACGPMIGSAECRSEIFDGHLAEAVLSFANEITLVADVAAPLLDFASMWVQSNSSLDFIIGQSFPPSWCSLHRPVLSLQETHSHWVYSAIDPLEPDGQPVCCHSGCGRENLDPETLSRKVKIKCILCRSICEVKVTQVDIRAPLGRKGLLKVPFPTSQARTEWTFQQGPKGPSTGEGSKPANKPSQGKGRRRRGGAPKQGEGQHGRGGVPEQGHHGNSGPAPLPQLTVAAPPSSSQDKPHEHQRKRRRLENNSSAQQT